MNLIILWNKKNFNSRKCLWKCNIKKILILEAFHNIDVEDHLINFVIIKNNFVSFIKIHEVRTICITQKNTKIRITHVGSPLYQWRKNPPQVHQKVGQSFLSVLPLCRSIRQVLRWWTETMNSWQILSRHVYLNISICSGHHSSNKFLIHCDDVTMTLTHYCWNDKSFASIKDYQNVLKIIMGFEHVLRKIIFHY